MATQTKTIGTRQGWQFECKKEDGAPEDCGFLLRNHQFVQLAAFARTHAKESHSVDIPESYVRSVAQKVSF